MLTLSIVTVLSANALFGEILFSDALKDRPERAAVMREAIELLRRQAPASPLIKRDLPRNHPDYEGDIYIHGDDLGRFTLGEWDGGKIVIQNSFLDRKNISELALTLHHEASHADHQLGDPELLIIDEYSGFFSPRLHLLHDMLNEALAQYKEAALKIEIGVNLEPSAKLSRRPDINAYEHDSASFLRDLKRWMKGEQRYGGLPPDRFTGALFTEFVTGFLADTTYLDQYMITDSTRYALKRGKGYVLCPMTANPALAPYLKPENLYAVLNRYIEKICPPPVRLAMDAEALEELLAAILDRSDPALSGNRNPKKALPADPSEEAGRASAKRALPNLSRFRGAQRAFEELPGSYAELPDHLYRRYQYSFSPEELRDFDRLLGH
ncbi:MAG: hypothetical protein LBU28_02695 [Spirochaetaceae bacterium]|nr:hypothetical protein [Spirochaetaceae bacterium]